MTIQEIALDNPLGARVRVSDVNSKINANFADLDGRAAALESGAQSTSAQVTSLSARTAAVEALLVGVNHRPVAVAVAQTVSDIAASVSGNLVTGATDVDGDMITVIGASYGSATITLGSAFNAVYGTITIQASGPFTYSPNATAKTLRAGQSAVEVFGYKLTDGQGATTVATFTVTVTGTDSAPVAVLDVGSTPYQTAISGNVLSNDTNVDGTTLSVTSFSVAGVSGSFSPGATATFAAGSLVINANGAYSFNPASNFAGIVPDITYNETNGYLTASGTLRLTVLSSASVVPSNPVVVAMTGVRTFNVGPGQDYLDLDTVPWSTIGQPGDVVNVFYRSTPYAHKFAIAPAGTSLQGVYINGVTDSNGNRPMINADGCRTAAGVMSGTPVFTAGNEMFGIITIKRKPGVSTTDPATRPLFCTVQGFELYGARPGATAYDYSGTARTWDFNAGIWCQASTDITIKNNVIYDNGLGLFVNSQAGGDAMGSERYQVLYNHIYGNGKAGDGSQHNVYLQAYDTLFMGNYLGYLRSGAQGAPYKSRSGKERVCFNWIEGSGKLLDINQADSYTDGMVIKPDYGTTWAWGNVILTDERLGGRSYIMVHFGGDNGNSNGSNAIYPPEQDESSGAKGTSPANYRMQLYFWNNTVFTNSTSGGQQYLFRLSFPEQTCDAWGNIICNLGNANLHTMFSAGVLNWRGTNITYSASTLDNFSPNNNGAWVTVNSLGTLLTDNPLFNSPMFYDFSLAAGSPALNVMASAPSGIPSDLYTQHPLDQEPVYRSNGLFLRSVVNSTDLGAFELVPGAPPRSAPVNTVAPAITATTYMTGGTLTVDNGSWLYSPTAYAYQWQFSADGVTSWSNLSGQTSNTTTGSTQGYYRCLVTATNVVSSTAATSVVRKVSNAASAAVVQLKASPVPTSGAVSTAVMAINPTVGNVIVVFASAITTLSDNYGNTWTKVAYTPTSSYDGNVYDSLWTTTVTATGSGFTLTGTGSVALRQNWFAYEVNGVVDRTIAIYSEWTLGSGTITISEPRQLLLANGRCLDHFGSPVTYPLLSPLFVEDAHQSDGNGGQHAVMTASSVYTGDVTFTQGNAGYGALFSNFVVSFLAKP